MMARGAPYNCEKLYNRGWVKSSQRKESRVSKKDLEQPAKDQRCIPPELYGWNIVNRESKT